MKRWIRRLREAVRTLLRAHLAPGEIGRAVFVGVFIGCLPLYGLHLALCVATAGALRLNQALVYAAAHVSNPLIAPLLIAAEIVIGELLRYGRLPPGPAELSGPAWEMVARGGDLFLSCLLGSLVLGPALGALLGALAFRWARRREKRA